MTTRIFVKSLWTRHSSETLFATTRWWNLSIFCKFTLKTNHSSQSMEWPKYVQLVYCYQGNCKVHAQAQCTLGGITLWMTRPFGIISPAQTSGDASERVLPKVGLCSACRDPLALHWSQLPRLVCILLGCVHGRTFQLRFFELAHAALAGRRASLHYLPLMINSAAALQASSPRSEQRRRLILVEPIEIF